MVEWRNLAVLGFSKYSVSDEGVVRRDETGRTLTPVRTQRRILRVNLYHDLTGDPMTVLIGRVVCEMFSTYRPSPDFNTVIYLDGNRSNVRAANVMWRPRWFAVSYMRQTANPLWHQRPHFRNVFLEETGEEFSSTVEASMRHGLLELDVVASILTKDSVYPYWYHFGRL